MRLRRVVAVFVSLGAAAACGLSVTGTGGPASENVDGSSKPDARADANGADAESALEGGSALDGGDAADVIVDARLPDWPTHFGDLPLPATAPVVADLCAIDTDAPSYTTCPGGDAGAPIASPANMVISGDTVLFFVSALIVNRDVVVTGTKPLAIVSLDTISIGAKLSVSARGQVSGPGATTLGKGGLGTNSSQGGGGGGFGTDGGDGTGNDAPGGPAYGGDAAAPLVGGSPGGNGNTTQIAGTTSCGFGGGGGGALQLSAVGSLNVVVTGAVVASGAGGFGGCSPGSNGRPGAGGGSGGLIFIEAGGKIRIVGSVTANGGGGGSGSTSSGDLGNPGQDGLTTASVALGGAANVNGITECSGGNGGALGVAPTGGGNEGAFSGGGGGAAGRIFMRTRGQTPVVQGVVSPAAVQY